MNDTKATACMKVLAPSVMLVSGLAAFRGLRPGPPPHDPLLGVPDHRGPVQADCGPDPWPGT